MGRPAYRKEYVWRWITKGPGDSCWPWTGKLTPFGYGEMQVKGVCHRAHRLVYELTRGIELPRLTKFSSDSQIVMHSCDNPSCCNPKHLILGTPKLNTQDMIKKGRRNAPAGLGHCHAKFDAPTVKEIRTKFSNGQIRASLAREYGVTFFTINAIVNGVSYRDVS
jgi:hypothetical protein